MSKLTCLLLIAIVMQLSTLSNASTCGCTFTRGDFNSDTSVNVTDLVNLGNHLFSGGASPCNADAADVNDDGTVNVTDMTYLSSWLYSGGPAAPEPSQDGCDPTADNVDTCCSPKTGGGLSVTSSSATPLVADFDCNYTTSSGSVYKQKLHTFNSKSCANACCTNAEAECDHSETTTYWKVTFNVSDSQGGVQKEAYSDECVELWIEVTNTATWRVGPPCPSGVTGACKAGVNLVSTFGPDTVDVVFNGAGSDYTETFQLEPSPTFDPGQPGWQYKQGSAPTCALVPTKTNGLNNKWDSGSYQAHIFLVSFPVGSTCYTVKKVVFGASSDFSVAFLRQDESGTPGQPDVAKDEGMDPLAVELTTLAYEW